MKFVDELPASARGNRLGVAFKWVKEANELRDNPGKWALLTTTRSTVQAGSVASQINSGRLNAFSPAGSFEAVSRSGSVYVRYVGE